MCGVAGLFKAPGGDAVVRGMIAAMAHRGPDGQGFHHDEAVSLGHARLAIVDPSPAGHQPMSDEAGEIWITYNGEIYNWRNERAALEAQGWHFRSNSDTEVLLALYARFGEECFARLRGIFACAIYDRRGGPGREKLLLARDQFGIKPLLYHVTDQGGIVFASELKGMLASSLISRTIDPKALRTLLCFGSVTQPHTMLAGVAALPSAHYLVAGPEGVRMKRYWSLRSGVMPELRKLPYDEILRCGADVFEESVALQRMADVPVGAFLSGGVDSSLIVALMSAGQTNKLKTFSVGFENEPEASDESHDARHIAAHLGTDHTRVLVTGEDALASISNFAAALDQPSVDGFNSYFISRSTAQSVKVALSGTGSDELFAGYPWFAAMLPGPADAPEPRLLDRLLTKLFGEAASGVPDDGFLDGYGAFFHCFGPKGSRKLLAESFRDAVGRVAPMTESLALQDELPKAATLDRVSALCLNGYTRNQLLRDIDACAMASSLEVRVPFLDPAVADFALSLPNLARLRPGGDWLDLQASYDRAGIKRIIVDLARPYLPQSFFSDRAKRGFGLPLGAWLRGPLRDMLLDCLSPDTVRRRGLFEPAAVAGVLDRFGAGQIAWNGPWVLMITELWCRHVLDSPAPRLPSTRPGSVTSGSAESVSTANVLE